MVHVICRPANINGKGLIIFFLKVAVIIKTEYDVFLHVLVFRKMVGAGTGPDDPAQHKSSSV